MSRFEDSRDPPLERALAGLAALRFADQTLVETMTQIAGLTLEAVGGAEGVGLSVMEPDRAPLHVASADFVAAVDAVQYGLGEGPCLQAAATGRSQVCGSLGGDDRWPRFGPRAGRLGVHSVLSLPVGGVTPAMGSLNVYGHPRDAFTAQAVAVGERFAVVAAVTVANAVVLERSRRLTAQLEAAAGSRTVIDQAIGILMARTGGTAQEAFEHLKTISQTEGTKLVEVSRTLVGQAVARARARHATP